MGGVPRASKWLETSLNSEERMKAEGSDLQDAVV